MDSRQRGRSGITGLLVVLAVQCVPVMGGTPFTEEALSRGLAFNMQAYPLTQGYVGQGCGFADLDSDGDPDVVIIGRADGKVGIFENIGGGIFVDHTLTSGIPTMQAQEGFAAADYNADGFIDIYLTQATVAGSPTPRPNYLLRNGGSFTFTDVTASTGTSNGPQVSTGPSWTDYNGDGWLDLSVVNYAQPNALYRSNAGVTFTNVAVTLGLTGFVADQGQALSFQAIWSDYDRDGDTDYYVSNDRGPLGKPPNALWRNNGGTFTDVSVASGANVSIYSMGLGAGDIDNNGYTDFYVTNVNSFESDGGGVPYDGINPLLLNQGNGTFIESSELWEVDNRITSWAAIFFDYDNDGRQDLYVNNQWEPNSFFECEGAPPCVESAAALEIEAEFDPTYDLPDDLPYTVSFNAAVADVDGDGDLDLLVNNPGHRAELFINNEGQLRNSVRYNVVGLHPNLQAIGGNVETTVGGLLQFHEIFAGGNGYLGQNELIITAGLDQAETVDQAVIRWPNNGPTRTLTDLPANETWKIYPPSRLCDADGDGTDYDDFVVFSGCYVSGFSPGCEMMDFDGDSRIETDDLDACYVTAASDCNANGREDLAEIMLDLTIDGNQNSIIDCCEGGPVDDPNPVGNTLLLDRSASGEPELFWTAPPVDGSHAAADSYDVFRGTTLDFGLLANVAAASHTDTDTSPPFAFYLVGARNGCGSSGEEPF